MIRLKKGPKPEILVKNELTWTQTLLDRASRNEKPTEGEKTRYRHPEIRDALLVETKAKCAYCESKVRHIAHGDIEHIIPKSTAIQKTFLWENLTLACDRCNENKGDHFGDHEGFVDPYNVEPTDHFFFQGPMILPLAVSEPGQITERVLELNRIELVERRMERIQSLSTLIRNFATTPNPELREVLRKDIEINETAADREYAGMSRSFVKAAMGALVANTEKSAAE